RTLSRIGPCQVVVRPDGQVCQVEQDRVQAARDRQRHAQIREDVVDHRLVGVGGVGGRRADVLEHVRLTEVPNGAEVDVALGGEDALGGPGGVQLRPPAVGGGVVGSVVPDPPGGDDGPRRADAAADVDVAQDAGPEGVEPRHGTALDGDPAAQPAGDVEVP